MAVEPNQNPATESEDHKAMAPEWLKIDDICAGVSAIKKKTTIYLPRFTRESQAAYEIRLQQAPWRPEFTDALRNLCSKPFTKMVRVNEDAPEQIQGKQDPKTKRRAGGFVDDVDGRGNSLHVFSRETFVNGVKRGVAAIYVTFPDAAPARTVAEEKASGVRPYWVQIEAPNILALYTMLINGREVVAHIRFKECTIERDGFAEVEVHRIRIIELDEAGRPTSQTWRRNKDSGYEIEKPPEALLGVSEIPVALLFTGERSGQWRVKPPLSDLAEMQLELYRALSREDQILTFAGHPMLKGVGMRPPQSSQQTMADGSIRDVPAPQLEVGPATVLFAPPAGDGIQPDWDFIQPAAANIEVVGKHITKLTEDFRRLALQPTTSNSGNLTATGAAIEGAKSHSAIEVWANALKATLDQALKYTAEWLKIDDTVTATVHTDFLVGLQGGEELRDLGDMQKRKVISAKTEREEKARRGVLGPAFDEDEEIKRLAEEDEGLEPEVPIDPRTGMPIPPQPPVPPGETPPPPKDADDEDELQEAA